MKQAKYPYKASYAFQAIVLGLICVWLATPRGAESAEPDASPRLERELTFDIASQPLDSALLEFSKQSNVQVMLVGGEEIALQKAPAVKGRITAREALVSLLENTGFAYTTIQNGTVTIKRIRTSKGEDGWVTVAQADANVMPEGTRPPPVGGEGEEKEGVQLAEIVVTGTHIRGSKSASPLITIERNAIEAGGFTTFQQLIRTIPQIHSGGSQQDSLFASQGAEADNNLSVASGINLRGLGSRSTLVLLNGRRLPPADRASITDASLIPLSLIERMDVLPDGASAIYGSDAVGGVVNIITRRKFDGVEANITQGAATRGGYDETSAGLTGGARVGNGSMVFDYSYRRQSKLDASDRDFSRTTPPETWVFPKLTTHALYGGGDFDLSSDTHMAFDAYASQRDTNLLFNRFGQGDFSSKVRQYGGSLDISHALSGRWSADLGLMAGRNRIDDRTTAAPEDIAQVRSSVELLFTGPLWRRATGDLQLAVGGSYRSEQYDAEFALVPEVNADVSRNVKAVFSELTIPLVNDTNAIRGISSFQLSVAARHEDYSDFGTTTDPRFGLLWGINDQVTLRSTYGTSFRAPTLFESEAFYELDVLVRMPDPSVPSGETLTLLRGFGSNPDLQPEEATTWTVGFDYQSTANPNRRFSATYFNIEYDGRIDTAIDAVFDAFPFESFFPQLFDRTPDPALVAELISRPLVGSSGFLNLAEDPFDPGDIGALIDNRFQNIAVREMEGVDTSFQLTRPAGRGTLDITTSATYLFAIDQRAGVGAAQLDLLGTVGNPVDLKLRGDLRYSTGDWVLHAALNYNDSYRDIRQTPTADVSSWTTFDAGVIWTPAPLGGFQFALNAANLFDRDPPRVLATPLSLPFGYDPSNASPLGRFISARVQKRF